MTRRKLPIGIQTFREIREDDCYYVDKTAFILRQALLPVSRAPASAPASSSAGRASSVASRYRRRPALSRTGGNRHRGRAGVQEEIYVQQSK